MIDKTLFRNAVGHFPTGVCLVGIEPDDAAPFAMTINSFSSLSLEPPLILWSIQKNSDCYQAVMAAKKFSINILSRDQQALARQYATKGEHGLTREHYSLVDEQAPSIVGASVILQCELYEQYAGGDHDIIVGLVTDILSDDGAGDPLMFYKGGFYDLAA